MTYQPEAAKPINDGGQAFPLNAPDAWGGPVAGMTYRQWLIGQALTGIASRLTPDEVLDIASGVKGGAIQAAAAIALADKAIERSN